MTDLIEQVARMLCEADAYHPDSNWGKGPVWTHYKPEAKQAIAIIVERCATVADAHLEKSISSAEDFAATSIADAIRTLAGGENNGGV